MDARITPRTIRGTVAAIPSKSYAQRLIIASLLCKESLVLDFFDPCEDIARAQNAVAALRRGEQRIEFGDSATLARILTPVLAVRYPQVEAVCSEQLSKRPLETFMDNPPRARTYRVPGSLSSQYISGLLFALPLLDGDSRIELTSPLQSAGYVDITLEVLSRFGVTVMPVADGGATVGWGVAGKQEYRTPAYIPCEGDWSSAAVLIAAGARVSNLEGDTFQPDGRAFLPYCQQADGRYRLKKDVRLPEVIDVSQCPDLTPVLAVMAATSDRKIRIVGGRRLRIKESDRLTSISRLITDLGGCAEVIGDEMLISGTRTLAGGTVDSWGDHRIVMAAALASCWCEKAVTITDAHVVAKSYPRFFDDFRTLGGCVELT
jgi:3-phosphoshikimate 1-carboxyvinyltransferase